MWFIFFSFLRPHKAISISSCPVLLEPLSSLCELCPPLQRLASLPVRSDQQYQRRLLPLVSVHLNPCFSYLHEWQCTHAYLFVHSLIFLSFPLIRRELPGPAVRSPTVSQPAAHGALVTRLVWRCVDQAAGLLLRTHGPSCSRALSSHCLPLFIIYQSVFLAFLGFLLTKQIGSLGTNFPRTDGKTVTSTPQWWPSISKAPFSGLSLELHNHPHSPLLLIAALIISKMIFLCLGFLVFKWGQ